MGLIICDHDYDIDANIKNYRETGWNATIPTCVSAGAAPTYTGMGTGCTTAFPSSPKNPRKEPVRFSMRHALRQYGRDPSKIPLEAVQATVKQFVLHHDGLAEAYQCFHVLHNERGLSCHFIIDNDGTIYQTLDLALCGFHASEYNPISIGVEISNRGEWGGTGKDGQYYADKKRFPYEHPEAWCTVRGSKIHCYDFTKPQYDSMHDLAKALTKLLPGIALDYPQDVPGHVNRGLVDPNAWGFSGYLGHLHLTTRKWDPGPFDFKTFIDKLRGSLCFPVWTGKAGDHKPEDKPQIPDSIDELDARTAALYDINEHKSEGGYFPVGPWGESRLWHGGVHIPQPDNGPPAAVFAPFPGRIVLARMGAESSVGSVNFVLLKHEMTVGPQRLRFYSLYMHLLDELSQPQQAPPFMAKDGWKAGGKKGEVVMLDEPVEAGEIIGRFGTAGPSDTSKKQIHFEIFSTVPLHTDEDTKWWTAYDGSATGRFCEVPDIISVIDTKTVDGVLQPEELTEFFDSSGDRASFHKIVVYNVSEWTDRPDWAESLRTPADFRSLPPEEIDAMVEEQIKPGLWWTEKIAHDIRLPRDGMVYHYHPFTFVQWINYKILEAANEPPVDEPTTEGTAGMTGDFEPQSDDSDMFNEAVADGRDPFNDAIDMPHLVEGFDGEPELDQ